MGHYLCQMAFTATLAARRPQRRGRRGAGTVRRRGKSWEARWIENGERRTQGGFASKDDAAQFLKRRSNAVTVATGLADLGLPLPAPRPRGTVRTFGALVDDWFEVRKGEGIRMVHEDRWRWDRHLAPVLSRRTPDSVEPRDLHRWVSALRNPDPASRNPDGSRVEPISGPTAERVVHLLSAFYRWSIREGHASRNPCTGIQRDAGMAKMLRSTHAPDSSVVLQSRNDVERIYRAIPVHYVSKVRQPRKPRPVGDAKPQRDPVLNPVPIAYLISAMAGLRPGEVVPLEWSDIDFERRVIHVRRNYRNGDISLPKSGKGREAPIVPHLLKELQGWRKLNPGAVLVCPPVRNTTRGETCFVGTPLIKKMLDQACDACHIPRGDFYDLGRRTFATLAAKAGLSPYRLKEIMGHASIETTMRYVRFAGALTDDEISALDLAS